MHMHIHAHAHTCIHTCMALRTVTEVTAPAALSSVALLKDGFTLIGGGADGESGEREREREREREYVCTFVECNLVLMSLREAVRV